MPISSSDSFPKGAILTILWLMLITFCDPSIVAIIKYDMPTPVVIIGPLLLFILYLALPVIGLYADIKWGRFEVAVGCLLVSLLVTFLYILESVLVIKGIYNFYVFILAHSIYPFFIVAHRGFIVIMLSIGTDQLIEGSSQQLSSFIWWNFWCLYFGWFVTTLVACSFHSKAEVNGLLYLRCIHCLCLFIILFSLLKFKNWLILNSTTGNPIMLIIKVLNFARKNKYPGYRSAMTYWQEFHPSRVDLAKDTYGGPFKDDDVESVKTFFRLFLLLLCILLLSIITQPLGRTQEQKQTISQCLVTSSYFILYLVALVCIPLKQTFLQCSKTLRLHMLQRIGFGIILFLISKIIFTSLDYVVTHSNPNITCILTNTTQKDDNYIKAHLVFVIPEIIGAVGVLFILPTTLEFMYAQSPYSMRTLFIGMFIAMKGIFDLMGWELLRIFFLPFFTEVNPSCEFYVFLADCLVALLSLILFICVGKWYKHRQRQQTGRYDSSLASYHRYGSVTT